MIFPGYETLAKTPHFNLKPSPEFYSMTHRPYTFWKEHKKWRRSIRKLASFEHRLHIYTSFAVKHIMMFIHMMIGVSRDT